MAADEQIDQRKVMSEFLSKYGNIDEGTLQTLNFQFLEIRKEQNNFRLDDEYSCSVGSQLAHFMKNRYRDILPYDKNRVTLEISDSPQGYINASHIEYPGTPTKYIAAQAPLNHTIDDWWNMVCQYNVKVIVMLCKCFEADIPKCDQYWPAEKDVEKKFEHVSVVTLDEEKHDDECHYIHRRLRVTSLRYGERDVHQLNYTEWPDHGTPDGENYILELIELMNSLHAEDLESPLLLHCSAGCGRTGTVIAANIIRELINKKKLKNLDLKELVMELRRQRGSMVQTPGQYQLLHRVVAHYCKQAIGDDASNDQSKESKESNGIIEVDTKVPKAKPAISPKPVLENPLKPTTNGKSTPELMETDKKETNPSDDKKATPTSEDSLFVQDIIRL